MTTQQQTERDDALIAEAKEVADKRHNRLKKGDWPDVFARHLLELERSNWTPPAKPDRYLQVWREANAAYWSDMHQEPTVRESDQAAAAVLRKHFEPPSDVVEAAVDWRDNQSGAGIMARFILKGEQ